MVAILADDKFECISLNDNDKIRIRISLTFVPRGSIEPALVRVIAWRRTGDKPVSEPMLTKLAKAYMRL